MQSPPLNPTTAHPPPVRTSNSAKWVSKEIQKEISDAAKEFDVPSHVFRMPTVLRRRFLEKRGVEKAKVRAITLAANKLQQKVFAKIKSAKGGKKRRPRLLPTPRAQKTDRQDSPAAVTV